VAMAEQLAMLRAHHADLQKSRSETMEIAARAKLQVASVQEQAKLAEAARDVRAAEKTRVIEAKAAAEAEVEKLKQEHAQLVDQLEKLRHDFKATVDANRKLVDRIRAKRAS